MILQAFIRGALVIAIAALLSFALRNRSAALRHHIWATALVVQLCLLAFIPVLPKINLPIIPTIVMTDDRAEVAAEAASTNESFASPMNVGTIGDVVGETSPQAQDPQNSQAPKQDRAPINWLLAIYLIGVGAIVLRYLVGTLLMMRIAHKGERVGERESDGAWLVLAQRTARELDITRPITMIWGDKISIPITWGVLYPMILLPESAQEWPAERRRFVLVHEMAHVKRFDALTQLLAQLTAAIFWFSPFVWIAEWRMRIEREHACDDTVLQHGTEPTLYANQLLQMVRTLVRRRAQQPAFAALAMARKSEFEGRMLAILDPERPRAVTGVTSGMMFALLSLLIAAPVAAIDPFAFNVVEEPKAAASPVTPAPAVTSSDCKFETGTISTSVKSTDEKPDFRVELQRENHCVFATFLGDVDISPDDRRILEIPTNSAVAVREVTREGTTVLRIETDESGRNSRSFTVNDQAVANGDIERRWLARVLPEVMREGAINPQERVARMLASHGLTGTLSGIAEIRSPAARRTHYIALIRASQWTDNELGRIRSAASRNLDGNDLTAVLGAMRPIRKDGPPAALATPSGPINSDTELLDRILSGMSSGYDLRVALVGQLPKVDRAGLLMLARQAQRITSSYDLGEFLKAGAKQYLDGNDDELAAVWFKSAMMITSSYDRSVSLRLAIPHVQGSESRTTMLLRATAGMSSGYDKAALLASIAKAKLITTPALRTALLEQVSTLSSGSDRRTVLEALQ